MHGSSEVSIVESQIRETFSFVIQPEIHVKQKDVDGGFSWRIDPPPIDLILALISLTILTINRDGDCKQLRK